MPVRGTIVAMTGAVICGETGPAFAHAAMPGLRLVRAADLAAATAAGLYAIVIDAPADAAARAALLDAGAADAVMADIDPIELAARARAVLRRGGTLFCGDLALDLSERRAARAGRPLALHPREFAVLAHLARHRDRAVSRAALYAAVWGRAFDPGSNVVAVMVSRLRGKLHARGLPPLLHTAPGGYMLSAIAGG